LARCPSGGRHDQHMHTHKRSGPSSASQPASRRAGSGSRARPAASRSPATFRVFIFILFGACARMHTQSQLAKLDKRKVAVAPSARHTINKRRAPHRRRPVSCPTRAAPASRPFCAGPAAPRRWPRAPGPMNHARQLDGISRLSFGFVLVLAARRGQLCLSPIVFVSLVRLVLATRRSRQTNPWEYHCTLMVSTRELDEPERK
jgi:hypothetical protein